MRRRPAMLVIVGGDFKETITPMPERSALPVPQARLQMSVVFSHAATVFVTLMVLAAAALRRDLRLEKSQETVVFVVFNDIVCRIREKHEIRQE
jgi:hypothetical protein